MEMSARAYWPRRLGLLRPHRKEDTTRQKPVALGLLIELKSALLPPFPGRCKKESRLFELDTKEESFETEEASLLLADSLHLDALRHCAVLAISIFKLP